MPGCFFERDYGRISISMVLPELRPLHRGGRLLALDAVCSAADGNYRQSVADINAMFLMAEHIGSDPLLVSELVAIAVNEVAIESLQVIIANYHVPVDEFGALRIPDNVLLSRAVPAGIGAEEALRLATFDDVGSGQLTFSDITGSGHASWFADPPKSSAYRIFLLGSDLAAHRRFTAEMDRASRMPYWQARDRLRQLEQEVRVNPGGALTATLLPAVGKFMETATKADARRDVARLGLRSMPTVPATGGFPRRWTIWPPNSSRRCPQIRSTANR